MQALRAAQHGRQRLQRDPDDIVLRLLCVNTDLTVYMGRRPIGEWIGFDSSTNSSGLGLGMTDSLLYDASGFIGTANQSIFFDSLNRREPEDGT